MQPPPFSVIAIWANITSDALLHNMKTKIWVYSLPFKSKNKVNLMKCIDLKCNMIV